jgi:hypothetical protein
MQDAIKLVKTQSIIIDDIRYKFDSVYYMEGTGAVYVKVWTNKYKNYLNITVDEFIKHLKHGKKYIDS